MAQQCFCELCARVRAGKERIFLRTLVELTLHPRLDDVKRMNDQGRHRAGGQAGDSLDDGGRDARIFDISHSADLSHLIVVKFTGCCSCKNRRELMSYCGRTCKSNICVMIRPWLPSERNLHD